MVMKYSPARTSRPLGSKSTFRRVALVGAALSSLSFSACEQLTGEPDQSADTNGGNTDTSGPDGSTPIEGLDPQVVSFGVSGGKTVEFGAVYEPMTAQGLKPYSFWMGTVTVGNRGSKPLKIVKAELVPLGDTLPSEWTLRTSELEEAPLLDFQPVEVAPGTALGLSMRYFPQQTQTSQARLVITDENGDQASMILSGRCRDYANISHDVSVDWSFNWGHANSQSKFSSSSIVSDSAGNSYISGNATQWGDQFNHNIVVAAFNAQGGVSWAKEWNEPYAQEQQDTGQNGQTGGSMSSIAEGGDGHVYVAGRRSTTQTNNTFQALIMKVRESDGGLAWAKGWVPEADVDVGAEAYAVDATLSDRVLFTGVVEHSGGGVLFGALSKETGEPIFALSVKVGGSSMRGYGIAANAAGDAYLVGWSGNNFGYLLRFTGCNTATPTLVWGKAIGLPIGSSAHNVAMASDGGAYVGFDIRGATTLFAFARFNKDGNAVWSKYYDELARGDVHTQYAIKEVGDKVYVAGRIGLSGFDYTGGDGLVLRVAASDGSYDSANIYYTGTTASTNSDHRVKGMTFNGDKLHLLMQAWTGPRNSYHYWGHWYSSYDTFLPQPTGDGELLLGDYELDPVALVDGETISVNPITTGRSIAIDAGTIWTNPPSSVKATPTGTMSGNGSHYTAVIQQLTIEP